MQMIFDLRHLAGNWTYNKRITEHLTKNPNPGRAEEDKTALEDVKSFDFGILNIKNQLSLISHGHFHR